MFPPVEEQVARIADGTAEILPRDELAERLDRSRASGEPLVVKQGFDPTRPDLHIGHAVSLDKLRTFQELGHRVVFVIGDYTARIGDPSGQSETRPVLTEEEIERNLATYREQVFRILDPEGTELRRNGEWLALLRLEDVLRLTAQYTVARMLERDDFATRHAEGRPISLVEFLYPMMQAYDSVALGADVELGGTDQKFNLLLGRTLQERAGQAPQICVIMPLLRGTDGTRKMSKSYGNTIGLTMPAEEMYGRTMSISDDLLPEWIGLASGAPAGERDQRRKQVEGDPLGAKRWLAGSIAGRYHGPRAAREAEEAFDRIHRERGVPEEMPLHTMSAEVESGAVWIGYALTACGLASSTSDALRQVEQGAVRVDGEVVRDRDCQIPIGSHVVQRGKRSFARLVVETARDE